MKCKRCESLKIVKNGKRKEGTQEYKCKECSHRFTGVEKYQQLSKEKIELIHKMYAEKGEQRKIGRILNVSHSTIQYHLKKN